MAAGGRRRSIRHELHSCSKREAYLPTSSPDEDPAVVLLSVSAEREGYR
jgi:hypothetical protein